MSGDGPIQHDEAWLVEAMAQAVGRDKARDALRRAAAKLGLGSGEVAARNAARVLAEVSHEPGLLGLVARRLLTKVSNEAPAAPKPKLSSGMIPIPSEVLAPPAVKPPTPSHDRVSLDELVPLLERSLGREKSRALLEQALAMQGAHGGRCTHEQALAALELLAKEPGLVGITARFAKPRFLLRAG